MLNTRWTIVVVATALVIGGGGVWYLRSNSQVDTATTIKTPAIMAEASTTAQPQASETPAEAAPQSVADIIDGYDGMTHAEKSKAVRTLLGTTQDRAVATLLNKEYTTLMNDGAEHANKRFEGVVPNGWKSE